MDLESASRRTLEELHKRGLLLESDRSLPSVTWLVNGGPVYGSWWAHRLSHEIYIVCQRLRRHVDVTVAMVLSQKLTYVHRRLWPHLYAIGTGSESWQFEGLSESAKMLLERVCEHGALRLDQPGMKMSRKELAKDARSLELRLLVLASDIHTESGEHVKQLESWQHWRARMDFKPAASLVPAHARTEFDRIVARLYAEFGSTPSLPWRPPPKGLSR